MQLIPLFIASPLTYSLKDTYVHNWVAPIIKPVQWFLDKFTPGGTIKQVNLSKCEFKEM
jgi:hypothetical protein